MVGNICGIYAILNKKTNQIYVGQSINIKNRFKNHKWFLNHRSHCNDYLQHAWNKYGEDSFEFIILENCSKEELNDRESWWIGHYNSDDATKGYNLTSGGDSDYYVSQSTRNKLSKRFSGKNHPMYGRKHSLESRAKMSRNSNPPKGELSPWWGRHHTEESKKKISEANKGRIPSEKTRKKMSLARRGEKNYFYGKTHSLESRKKMSESQKGKIKPLEHRLKQSLAVNKTGYFRVAIEKCELCKQGFVYTYQWRENGKNQHIRSVDIEKLKQKVIARGLEWVKLDEDN